MSVLVGKKAPDFKANALVDGKIVTDFTLSHYLNKQYVLLFFYPKDFTFVCPTELHAFQDNIAFFKDRNVAVIACSTDTAHAHLGWYNLPREKGGIEGVNYPIVADTNKTIAAAYDVLTDHYYHDEEGELAADQELVAYRGLFLIDKDGIVQHQLVNNMPIGRSIKEALRTIDALQNFERFGEVCPMDWEKGKQALKPNHESTAAYLASTQNQAS